jgi:hypothetical protein
MKSRYRPIRRSRKSETKVMHSQAFTKSPHTFQCSKAGQDYHVETYCRSYVLTSLEIIIALYEAVLNVFAAEC